MPIQFLCPNGHKIHCSEDHAGKPAKCPKCGVKFRVPAPAELEGAREPEEPVPDGPPENRRQAGMDSQPSGVDVGPATDDDQIEFLCPNNHLLHGPAILQGQPGVCPKCGSKFRIPSYDEAEGEGAEGEVAEGEEALGEEAVGGVADGEEGYLEPESPTPLEPSDSDLPSGRREPDTQISLRMPMEIESADIHVEDLASMGDVVALSLPASGPKQAGPPFSSLASLFAVLWAHKSAKDAIEVRHTDGQRFCPDHFLASMSRGSHGVFAIEDPNGTYTLTVVPWDCVSSVVIHGVKRLPSP